MHRIRLNRIFLVIFTLISILLYSSYSLANGLVPLIFNAPMSAKPGDIIGLQGDNFGDNPSVVLEKQSRYSTIQLPLVNQFGQGWLSFKIPENTIGAIVLHINNGKAMSAPIKLNAALAFHLDAFTIVPSGSFRIFGRNLKLNGFTPSVTVNDLVATINQAESDENMLVVSAPIGLQKGSAIITVDNGNGTGPSKLDRNIEIESKGERDSFNIGVGWAMAFSNIDQKKINTLNDDRLNKKVLCDGKSDDTSAIQLAIELASNIGGGIVQLPAGVCRVAGTILLRTGVVLQGQGKNSTLIRYESNYPIWAKSIDLSGVKDLALINVAGWIESPIIQNSSRFFLKDVTFNLGGGNQMFVTGNKNIAIINCEFIQPKNSHDSGTFYFGMTKGFVFSNNIILFANGSSNFDNVNDAYIANNYFKRDIRDNLNSKGVIHTLTINFAYRIAIIGNSFLVDGGPITNKSRNDGETLLTEGGGANRTENVGYVSRSSGMTITDSNSHINEMPFISNQEKKIPENYGVVIVGGKGAGQSRRVVAYDHDTLSVDRAWDEIPDNTSRYATFVWGLEKSLIKGNILSQNSRGIWLYQTAVQQVDIIENKISEGGGIYLRTAQILKDKLFTPMLGIKIANNSIINTSREWPSYINLVFVRTNATDFGIATIGVEIKDNYVQANKRNLHLTREESGQDEGYFNKMHLEAEYNELPNETRLLGTIFQRNTCVNCKFLNLNRNGTKATVQEENFDSVF
jgi:hypothetical protein